MRCLCDDGILPVGRATVSAGFELFTCGCACAGRATSIISKGSGDGSCDLLYIGRHGRFCTGSSRASAYP